MPFEIPYAFSCVFLAAVVRGFSGFGFALLTVISLSFVLPPATIVPAMFVLEVAAGVHLVPSIWRDIHWRSIAVMVGTAVVFTPMGVYCLATAPVAPMKLVLAGLYLGARLAGRVSEAVARRVVLAVLMGMAVATAAQSFFPALKGG
ncbi:TSUP family transporter [Komagataeibacter swingsii]|uniref:Probable membrane transporter protein n=1 Tax=Komagataeibacter swingsii TaxID=215220 RepID=A0A850P1D4_9PROT|nr:TSUP family transporter [Komagataeibacter swingsii]NVN38487.1 hypothetical protein [Komagataeibacter swingsii]